MIAALSNALAWERGNIKTFPALIGPMLAGDTYVNVHTNKGVRPIDEGPGDFPGGASARRARFDRAGLFWLVSFATMPACAPVMRRARRGVDTALYSQRAVESLDMQG